MLTCFYHLRTLQPNRFKVIIIKVVTVYNLPVYFPLLYLCGYTVLYYKVQIGDSKVLYSIYIYIPLPQATSVHCFISRSGQRYKHRTIISVSYRPSGFFNDNRLAAGF